jgi:hypothetical protein
VKLGRTGSPPDGGCPNPSEPHHSSTRIEFTTPEAIFRTCKSTLALLRTRKSNRSLGIIRWFCASGLPYTLQIIPYTRKYRSPVFRNSFNIRLSKLQDKPPGCSLTHLIKMFRWYGTLRFHEIVIHFHPVHNSPHTFPKIRFDIILPSTPRSSELSLPQIIDQNSVCIFHACYMSPQ